MVSPHGLRTLTTDDGLPVNMLMFSEERMDAWRATVPLMEAVLHRTYSRCIPGPVTAIPRGDDRCWVVVPVYFEGHHVADILPVLQHKDRPAEYVTFAPTDYCNTPLWMNE